MGSIITFYSYKGGVGRSMALANVGSILTQWGYRVLLIDFDLEAPGLETFFDTFLDLAKVRSQEGLVDYIHSHFILEGTDKSISDDMTIKIRLPRVSGQLEMLTAGRQDDSYFEKVTDLDFRKLYATKNAGHFIESFRQQLKDDYDFILIDSRTGLTDIGGVCTVQFPDLIILLSTATEQALRGGIDIVRRATKARQNMPFQRAYVPTLPIPSRIDSASELRLTQNWLDRFGYEFGDLYAHRLPRLLKPRDILDLTTLPHVPFFSYGESLPVIEYGTTDPRGLGYAYETVASLVGNNLQNIEQSIENRDAYVSAAVRETAANVPDRQEPRIFLSHSHKDRRLVERFLIHLKPITTARNISVWTDLDIEKSTDWQSKLREEISKSDVAVLFVSADYLASNWITKNELPVLLKASEEKGLRILTVVVSPSAYFDAEISQFQALNDPSTPLTMLSRTAREQAISQAVRRIAEVAGRKY